MGVFDRFDGRLHARTTMMNLGGERRAWIRSACVLALVATFVGCQSWGGRGRVARTEPSFSGNIDDDVVIGDAPTVAAAEPPGRTVGYVDRHPLLSKPREYWESSGDNRVVKAAAATFIGVPAGVVGELRQIIVGAPPEIR